MALDGLQEMLEGNQGGIWFLHGDAEWKEVQKAAKKAGYAFFHVDGKSIARKEQLMNALATALRLPKHFGKNWDALEESFSELEWEDSEGFVLYYDHLDPLLQAHPDQVETFLEILRDSVSSWKDDGETMVVLLSGSKAPKGVSALPA